MKTILAAALVIGSAFAAFGDGTIFFSNNFLTRVKLMDPLLGPQTVPTTPGLINYGVFYGIGESTSLTFLSSTLGVNSTSTAGLIASAADSKTSLVNLSLPGTTAGESDVWLQIKGWSAEFGTDWAAASEAADDNTGRYFFGETDVRNIAALGPDVGPGIQIWQSATGTNPNRFYPLVLYTTPEPGTLALAALGGALLMMRRRGRVQEK